MMLSIVIIAIKKMCNKLCCPLHLSVSLPQRGPRMTYAPSFDVGHCCSVFKVINLAVNGPNSRIAFVLVTTVTAYVVELSLLSSGS
jgi:hypothetical protein